MKRDMTPYQHYISKSRYSRFLDKEGRREHWPETVKRYFDFMEKHLFKNHAYTLTEALRGRLQAAVTNLEVVPSMRSIMTAGDALERQNVAGYNCSYLPIDDPKAFDESMYILLCGTGVGFSVEQKYVNKLPEVPKMVAISILSSSVSSVSSGRTITDERLQNWKGRKIISLHGFVPHSCPVSLRPFFAACKSLA